MTQLERLINELSPEARTQVLATLKTQKKKKTHVPFPVIEARSISKTQMCISRQDAIRFFGEVLIPDCTIKSTATLKAQVVEAFVTLAEVTKDNSFLQSAAKFVMIESRDHLIKRLTTYATLA